MFGGKEKNKSYGCALVLKTGRGRGRKGGEMAREKKEGRSGREGRVKRKEENKEGVLHLK